MTDDPKPTWLALAIIWLLSFVVVGVAGAFPLFDDWVYSSTARTLAEQGVLTFAPSAEVLMLPQFLWGWLFTLPTGFSYPALRVSTLIAAIVASAVMVPMLRGIGGSSLVAAAAAIVLATTPVFHVLAYTFMSDVPTVTLMAVSLWAYVHSVAGRNRDRWFWISVAVAAVACLNRITAVTLVAGLLLGYFTAQPSRRRAGAVIAAAIAVALLLAVTERVLLVTVGLPGMYHFRAERSMSTVETLSSLPGLVQVGWAMTRAWLHLGLMMLPLALICRVRAGVVSWLTGLALAMVLLVFEKSLPLMGNIFYDGGLGPVMLPGVEEWSFGASFWWVVTVAAVVGTALVSEVSIAVLRRVWHSRGSGAAPATAVQVTALSAIVMLIAGHALHNVFDRYLIMALPAALLLVAAEPAAGRQSVWMARVGWTVALATAAFAILATRDSMEWQRVRWTVIEQALASGIAPESLDGGQEFNGLTSGSFFAPGAVFRLQFVAAPIGPLCATASVIIGPRAGAICVVAAPQ